MAHNTNQKNAEFRAAWDATNTRYINSTKWAITETYRRRHENEHVRQACRDNMDFYRKHKDAE